MNTIIFVLMSLSCPATQVTNVSKEPFNDYDRSMLKQAKKRCGELYPDAPCVKLFRKYNVQQYSVICGAERKK